MPIRGSARVLLSRTWRLAGACPASGRVSGIGDRLSCSGRRQAAGRAPDAPLKLAQAQGPTIEVVQTLVVEPATDAPLSLQLKTTGRLPPQSFVRIRGLPPAASLSEGHFVRPGVWAVPLSSLSTVRITVPAAQAGRAELTISLVTRDNAVLAEARTTLVVGAASLFSVAPPAPKKGQSAALDGPEVTLRMKGGAFELRGRLKSFEGGRYVIENKAFGTMTLDAANMECIGAGCPGQPRLKVGAVKPPTAPAPKGGAPSRVIGLHGSTAVGWELMPALILAYVDKIGGSVRTVPGANPLEESHKVIDARGREIVVFDLKRYGTPTAFDGLEDGSAQIGIASRPINDQEAARLARAGTPGIRSPQHEHVLGLDGLVVIVAQDNPAVSLSIDNIAKIFAGQVTDWSEVGLPPGKINVYSTSKASGTFAAFELAGAAAPQVAACAVGQAPSVHRRGGGRGGSRRQRYRRHVFRLHARRQGAQRRKLLRPDHAAVGVHRENRGVPPDAPALSLYHGEACPSARQGLPGFRALQGGAARHRQRPVRRPVARIRWASTTRAGASPTPSTRRTRTSTSPRCAS